MASPSHFSKKSSLEIVEYINSLKDMVRKQSGLFETNGKGKELFIKLLAYKRSVADIFEVKKFSSDPYVQATLKHDSDVIENIPIHLVLSNDSLSGEQPENAENWSKVYFKNANTITALTIL